MATQTFLIFTQILWGNDPIWLAHIFQVGWNHQLAIHGAYGGIFAYIWLISIVNVGIPGNSASLWPFWDGEWVHVTFWKGWNRHQPNFRGSKRSMWITWWNHTILGGGNSNICYFHPKPWGNDPSRRADFSDRLVQPPTSIHWVFGTRCFWFEPFESSNSFHQTCQELPGRGDLEAMELPFGVWKTLVN